MGTILASAIISKCRIVLNDPNAVRWADNELLGWLNLGQTVLAGIKPDASATVASAQLVAGTKQTVPTAAVRPPTLRRNMGANGSTPGPAIEYVSLDHLDAFIPNWHTSATSGTVKAYALDERTPRVFYVYPPQPATPHYVEMSYPTIPAALANTSTAISVGDEYEPLLIDYILYKAFAKDAEEGNAQRAEMHRAAFFGQLGVKASSDAAVSNDNQG
jgi:hypothetical protein